MEIAEFCVWFVVSVIAFVIFMIIGFVSGKGDREIGFMFSLLLSSFIVGFCLTYIMQMKGVI